MTRNRIAVLLLVTWMMAALTACGGGGTGYSPTPAPPPDNGGYTPPPNNPPADPPDDPTPPILTVRVVSEGSIPVPGADVVASHDKLNWSEQTGSDGRARITLTGISKDEENDVVVVVAKDGYQSTTKSLTLSAQDDQTYAEMKIVPVGNDLSTTLRVQLWNGATGTVVVSDVSGNHVAQVLSSAGLTTVEFTPLVCSEIKIEARVDGYQAYVERIPYTVISNMSYVLWLNPTDLQPLAGPTCLMLSYDYIQYSGAKTWLATLGTNGAKLTVNMPSGMEAGVIADGDSVLLVLKHQGEFAIVPAELNQRLPSDVIAPIVTMTQLNALSNVIDVSQGAWSLFSNVWDPYLDATIAGSNGRLIGDLLESFPGTRLLTPGTYTYEEAKSKILTELQRRTTAMMLFVGAGGTGAFADLKGLPGIKAGGIIAALTNNSLGLADVLSASSMVFAEAIQLGDHPSDQRYVIVTNPLINLALVVGSVWTELPLGALYAVLPVEPHSTMLYPKEAGQTAVTVGNTEQFNWKLDFGGEASTSPENWRPDSLTVWTDDPAIATVIGKSNGYGIQVAAHKVGATTLRASYHSPPPFDDRASLSVALHPVTVVSAATGLVVCRLDNADDDQLTVLWSIDSAVYDHAVDVPSLFCAETNAVAVTSGQHTVYIKWFDADTGQNYFKQEAGAVVAGQTTKYTFNLDEHLPATVYYTLTVDTQPVSGNIYVNGSLSGTGHSESDYPKGTDITVSFGSVAGYTAPADQHLVLNADTSRVGNYTPTGPSQCQLTVNTTPIAGKIWINGDLAGTGSYEGTYDVGQFIHLSYGDVASYITPSSEDFTLSGDTSKVGEYTYVPPPPDKWDLTVLTEPGGLGAPIDVTWLGGEQSGTDQLEVLDLEDGTEVTITFGDVTNYITPDPIMFAIHSNVTKIGTYEYIQPPPPPTYGTLMVKTHNVCVDVFIDGENQGSGESNGSSCHGMWTVTKDVLADSSVVVAWRQVDSWIMPSNRVVTVPEEGLVVEVYPKREDMGGIDYTYFQWPYDFGNGDRYVYADFTPGITNGNVFVEDTTGQYHAINSLTWHYTGSNETGYDFDTDSGYYSHVFVVSGTYTVVLESLQGYYHRAIESFNWHPK